MHRRIAVWLAIMMVTVSVSSAWAATPGVVDVNQLNLRSGPGQAYRVISTLSRSTSLVVLAESGEWKQVLTSSGLTGWVFGQYIVTDPSFSQTTRNVVVRATRLNVRQGPGTSYPAITSVVDGQLVQVTGKVQEWLQVQVSTHRGYVHQDFVADINASAPSGQTVGVPMARVVVNTLNLRSGTGTQFPIVTRLAQGTLVAVLEQGSWSRVMMENGVIGFVASEHIQFVGGQALARINASMVNQRTGPGTNFSVMATHPVGQTVTFGGWEGSWVKVSSTAGSGYILGSLVSFAFSNSAEAAPVPPPAQGTQPAGGELSGFIVVLDAGHGGPDPGAIGVNGLRESHVNLDMAVKLKEMLETNGATVIMTRTADVGLTLDQRIAFAHDNQADIFVSIHNNAHPSSSVSGTQTFYGVTPGSFQLGSAVHRRLVAIGLTDRGLLTANFKVLRATEVPAILTETAFLSNPHDAALLSQQAFINNAVNAHFEGVREYLLSARKQTQ